MVVLAQLNKPMYGYPPVKELEGKGISIEGNTLYPLLRRLESQGLLKSEWEKFFQSFNVLMKEK